MVLARWTVRALVVAGVACLLAGAVTGLLVVRFVTTAERTQGVVIANAAVRDRAGGDPQRSDTSFRPVVLFAAAPGAQQVVTFESGRGASPPRYRPGARVDVLYPADDPGAARLASSSGQWLLPLMLPTIGVVLIGTALLARLFTRSQTTLAESQSAA